MHIDLLRELRTLLARFDEQERERFELEHHDDPLRIEDVLAVSGSCRADEEVTAVFVIAGFSNP
jgi:hypothetical protein